MKIGDLVKTYDMGKASGKIGMIVGLDEYNFYEAENSKNYVLYDVIIDSELVTGMHSTFLQLAENENV